MANFIVTYETRQNGDFFFTQQVIVADSYAIVTGDYLNLYITSNPNPVASFAPGIWKSIAKMS